MGADDARKLFVGGVSDSVGEAELRSVFEAADFGVEYVAIPRDRETGKVRGFGFVTLASADEVSAALQRLNGTQLGGRALSMRPFSQEAPKRGEGGRPQRGPEPSLFLGKLPYDATEQEIIALFEARGIGPVQRVTLPLGPDGRPRGFGFVTLASDDAATDAIDKLNGAAVRGRPIVVSKAEPKGRGPGGPPGAGGGPRSDAPPRRFDAPRDGGGYGGGGYGGGGGGYGGGPSYGQPPAGPPPDDDRGRGGKGAGRGGGGKREADRRKTAAGPREGGKGPRGGGGNWHRWEDDD